MGQSEEKGEGSKGLIRAIPRDFFHPIEPTTCWMSREAKKAVTNSSAPGLCPTVLVEGGIEMK
jgi:hypothetical protein